MSSAAPSSKEKISVTAQVKALLLISGRWSYLLWASLGAGLLISLVSVVAADLSARLVDSMMAGDGALFSSLVVPVLLFELSLPLLRSMQRLSNQTLSQHTLERLRKDVSRHLGKMTAAAGTKEHSGQVLSRMTSDMGGVASMLGSAIPSIVTGSARAAAALAYMVYRNWALSIAAIVGAPLVFVVIAFLRKPIMDLSTQAQEALGRATEVAQESLAGAEVGRALGMTGQIRGRYWAETETVVRTEVRMTSLFAVAAGAGFASSFAPFVIVFGAGALLVVSGKMQLGHLMAFLTLLNYVTFPMSDLSGLLAQLAANAASAKRVLELLDTPVERDTGSDFEPALYRPAVEFKNVTFAYPGTELPALQDVSFAVGLGETVSLTGGSGSGKTTVLRLILGDYQPDAGEVLVFGQPVDQWSLRALRARMSVVSQDTYLFPFSVAENLRLGRDDLPDEQLGDAARMAEADGFIENLPQAYDQSVGELGQALSGGERQRLSLARALARPADFLLLDEATSSLDFGLERRIIDNIKDSGRKQTVLVIAHRLSSVRHADRALVFDQGRLVESGPPRELMSLCGRYYELYNAQLEGEESL